MQFQAKANIRLVAAIAIHGFGVGQPGEGQAGRRCSSQFSHLLAAQPADQIDHVLLIDEGHFHVKLGELRLAVGAQILVAEAAGDLEVAVEAGHHQQLFELLRALRQGVELARMHPAGHQVVARAFRR